MEKSKAIEGINKYYADKQNGVLEGKKLSDYVDIVDGRFLKIGSEKIRLDTFCKQNKVACSYTDKNVSVHTSSRVAAPSLSEHIIKFFIGRECFGLEELPEVVTIFEAAASFDTWFTLRNEEAYKQTKAAKKAAKKIEEETKKREEAANNFKSLDVDKKAAQLVEMGVFSTVEAAKKHILKQEAAKVTETKKDKKTA